MDGLSLGRFFNLVDLSPLIVSLSVIMNRGVEHDPIVVPTVEGHYPLGKSVPKLCPRETKTNQNKGDESNQL